MLWNTVRKYAPLIRLSNLDPPQTPPGVGRPTPPSRETTINPSLLSVTSSAQQTILYGLVLRTGLNFIAVTIFLFTYLLKRQLCKYSCDKNRAFHRMPPSLILLAKRVLQLEKLHYYQQANNSVYNKVKEKGSGLYSAFIVVPHTQGAQVRIT